MRGVGLYPDENIRMVITGATLAKVILLLMLFR